MNTSFFRTVLAFWIPLSLVASLVIGLGYVQDQQIIRLGANEPQVQLAESIAAQVAGGAPPAAFVQGAAAPIETVQTPFILIADQTGQVVAGTGSIAGALPQLPKGVFSAVKGIGPAGENRVTWQPATNVREALVIAPFTANDGTKGYVIVGRSLRETEVLERALTARMAIGWVATLLGALIAALIGAWLLGSRAR